MSGNSRFIVDEVYKIREEGLVLNGEVERGVLRTGMTVLLEMMGQKYKVQKIKAESKDVDEASAGQQVGIILKGLHNVRVQLGEVLIEAAEEDS